MRGYVMNRESLKRHCEETCKRFGRSEVPYTSGTYGEHRFVLELLEQTEWIPCSERLPEEEGEYLTTDSLGTIEITKFFSLESEDMPLDFYFWNATKNCVNRYEKHDVIAWMPLPEPYKEESEE